MVGERFLYHYGHIDALSLISSLTSMVLATLLERKLEKLRLLSRFHFLLNFRLDLFEVL